MELNKEQMRFLCEEFDLSEDDIPELTYDFIRELREKCFNIEVEEATRSDNDNCGISERGNIAAQLVDITLSYLKSVKKTTV